MNLFSIFTIFSNKKNFFLDDYELSPSLLNNYNFSIENYSFPFNLIKNKEIITQNIDSIIHFYGYGNNSFITYTLTLIETVIIFPSLTSTFIYTNTLLNISGINILREWLISTSITKVIFKDTSLNSILTLYLIIIIISLIFLILSYIYETSEEIQVQSEKNEWD